MLEPQALCPTFIISVNNINASKNPMLESSTIEQKNPHSYNYLQSTHSCLQNEHSREATFRHRLHGLLSENFELKEKITRLQGELKASEQQRRELKERLRIVLEEMNRNDRIIENLKGYQQEHQSVVQHHLQEIGVLRQEMQHGQAVIANLIEHSNNLQTENQLLIEIKQRYASDLAKLRIDYDTSKASNEKLLTQNECLTIEVERLLDQIANLQNEMQTRRNDIEQYQKFVLQKLSSVKDTEQFHEQCRQKLQALHTKYSKYKHKASTYKRERDQLLFHLQHFSREIQGDTLRKYYDEVQ